MKAHEYSLPYRLAQWIAFIFVVGVEATIGLIILGAIIYYATDIIFKS